MNTESKGKPKIWLVRHGLSVFNYWSRTFGHRAAEYGNLGSVEKDPDYMYLQEIKDKLDTRLADPALHKKGISQAIKAQEKINKMNIKYVFISPLLRTLQTTKFLFANYPKLEQVHFVVHPLVRELMGSPCDVPVDTLKLHLKEFGFNFNMLEKFEKKDLFFLYSMNTPEREELFKEIAKNNEKPYIETIAEFIKKKKKEGLKGNRKIESFVNCRERAVQFAEFLINFIPSCGISENEDIVVITHSLFISYCTATYWTPDGSISVGNIGHCDPISFDYNWILQLRNDFSTRRVFIMAMLKLLPEYTRKAKEAIEIPQKPKTDKCSKGHKLRFARIPIGVFLCSHCQKAADSLNGRWHCVMCGENISIDCCSLPIPNIETQNKMCDYGHKLKLAANEYPWGFYRCKNCGTEDTAKNQRWNCKFCTYDLCLKCKAGE